jgi:methylenetetrahydrofolate dehydrogenase (NADP+) / methenyltetrahydrofolate cyclohydrolase
LRLVKYPKAEILPKAKQKYPNTQLFAVHYSLFIIQSFMLLLDGKALAETIKAELKVEVDTLLAQGKRAPHLAAILVGDNPASQAYVRNKIRFCEAVGYRSTLIRLDLQVTEDELLTQVKALNLDTEINGFIVQLPLPRHINEERVMLAIDHTKDVDGFHPINFGRMAQGMPAYLPATPYGILELLRRYKIETSGKRCVVVGRSNIVGTPMSILLSRKGYPGDCTVVLTHSRTRDIESEIRNADIVVAAIGIPYFVKADMIKPGAVVIDVGINSIEDVLTKAGTRLVGDVDYEEVSLKASAITPVPGGVGPMTVAALMLNTMKSYKNAVYGVV